MAFDVSVAPEGALARLASAINRPKRRALGLFKLESEFLGSVRANEFEIWERGQHAIHARGKVKGRRGGTRIEMRFVLSTRARVLMAIFVLLYGALALEFVLRPGETAEIAAKAAVAIGGLGVIGLIFFIGARRQQADLRAFVERVFGDLTRI